MTTDLVRFDTKETEGLVADLVAIGMILVPDAGMGLTGTSQQLTREDDGQGEAELTDGIRRRGRVEGQDGNLLFYMVESKSVDCWQFSRG